MFTHIQDFTCWVISVSFHALTNHQEWYFYPVQRQSPCKQLAQLCVNDCHIICSTDLCSVTHSADCCDIVYALKYLLSTKCLYNWEDCCDTVCALKYLLINKMLISPSILCKTRLLFMYSESKVTSSSKTITNIHVGGKGRPWSNSTYREITKSHLVQSDVKLLCLACRSSASGLRQLSALLVFYTSHGSENTA